MSDQRLVGKPEVLLNSVYQLLKYIINEQMKQIVEANVLESGQVGRRLGRSANIYIKKCTLSRSKLTDKESESIEST